MAGQKRTREDRWLGVAEAADYLGVSTKTIRRHAASLGARKLGSRLLFRPAEIDRRLDVLDPRESISAPKGLSRKRKADTDTALDVPDSHPGGLKEAAHGVDAEV